MPKMRTPAEIKAARIAMDDLFYPPKVNEFPPGPCRSCGEEKLHKVGCPERSSMAFTGWSSSVKKTAEPNGECDACDCKKDAVMRIRLNVWGSLYEFDTCKEHGTIRGKSRDGHCADGL